MSPALTYETMPAGELTAEQRASWNALAAADPALASPFFRAEYASVVAQVRSVDVCLLRSDGEAVGFFPFERVNGDVGRPVGGGMSNFQGVIAARNVAWNAAHLARSAVVRSLQFHHQLTSQPAFTAYSTGVAGSPYVDLSSGWDAYLTARRASGVERFKAVPREIRRFEREVGPLTFVPHTTDADVLEHLLTWKRAQYDRTGARGSLQQEWSVDALRRLLAVQEPGFAGMLSCLRAGDRLVAVHAGIRSATEWHYWYPAYDAEVGRHSPGLILLYEIARFATTIGIKQINLGKGESQYKAWFASGEIPVATGEVRVGPLDVLASRLARKWRRLRRRTAEAT
jgi:CelD/BcsL family acetyltransferase involved in cellulose biosynthesis